MIQDEDHERESDIRAAGWRLDAITPRAMRERPARTIARLIRFLAAANPNSSILGGPNDLSGR